MCLQGGERQQQARVAAEGGWGGRAKKRDGEGKPKKGDGAEDKGGGGRGGEGAGGRGRSGKAGRGEGRRKREQLVTPASAAASLQDSLASSR